MMTEAEIVAAVDKCVAAGLMGRDGDRVWITERGRQVYERLKQLKRGGNLLPFPSARQAFVQRELLSVRNCDPESKLH